MIYRVKNGYYHTVCPLSPLVIYHESKIGPFLGEDECEYPDWAPVDANSPETRALMELMEKN